MAIVFLPTEFLEKAAPKKLVKKLVNQNLTLNRAALTILSKADILSKKQLTETALKVIKGYRERYGDERAAGLSAASARAEAVNGAKLMVSRVENAVVHEVAEKIKQAYVGERYEWLPSDAEEPDPLHQLKYGKRYTMGVGEMPGDRYGCRCGMRILVPGEELELEDEE